MLLESYQIIKIIEKIIYYLDLIQNFKIYNILYVNFFCNYRKQTNKYSYKPYALKLKIDFNMYKFKVKQFYPSKLFQICLTH